MTLLRTSKCDAPWQKASELQDGLRNSFLCRHKLGSDEENVASFSHFHHEFTGMNPFFRWYQDISSLPFPIQSINKADIRVQTYLLWHYILPMLEDPMPVLVPRGSISLLLTKAKDSRMLNLQILIYIKKMTSEAYSGSVVENRRSYPSHTSSHRRSN